MVASVKTNYIFNLINTLTQVLLPLITFPYASRILLPEGIGHVNSFMSIINVIILGTSLGIPLYSVREVANVREDMKKMNTVTFEVLSLHAVLTVIGYVIVSILCFAVPQINKDIPLFLLLSLSIVFTTIGCEWFYQAVEDFKYVTLRGIIIRTLSIVFLLIFVKTKDDIMWYGAFTVFGVLGSNIFNFFRLRKYLRRQYFNLSELHPLRHLKGVIKVFAFNVITSIYVQLNTVFLGFFQSDSAAGYYTAAMKLNLTAITVTYALANVMLPRLSNLFANGDMSKFKEMAQKSYDFSWALTLPMSIGLIFVSPYAMILLSGQSFAASIAVSQLISFTVFFIALSSVMGIQMLYPMGYMNIVVHCVTIGCLVDIIFCLLLIPALSQNGAAVAYLAAEFAVTFSMYLYGRKILPLNFFKKSHLIYLFAVIIMSIVLFAETFLHINYILKLFVMMLSGAAVYLSILFLIKDPLTARVREIINEKLNKNK